MVNKKGLDNLVPFKKGYDPKRGNLKGMAGRKPKPPCSIEKLISKVLIAKSPKKFYKDAGYECPKQYRECDTLLEAIFLNQAATALGAKKGNTLGAANLLLDRLYGKAAQHIKLSSDITEQKLEEMSDEDLKKIIESEET
ncbi:hypothetical protein KAR91_07180 [Candidatus Pacearchaeota archaeon]|nr:hypothetical protein [Candidatus Pacearchaeota archaeon]